MFKIGQKVVCKSLKTRVSGTPFGIKLGKIYVIEQIINCPICNEELLCLVGVDTLSKKYCSGCYNLTQWSNTFSSWRFEPLKYDLIPNKLIIAEIIKEKIDTETKIPVEV